MNCGRVIARRWNRIWLACLIAVLACCWSAGAAHAAGYRTANFLVDAPTEELARRIGDAAEHYRHTLAVEWLGRPLPRWSRPCPIKAQVAPHLGAGAPRVSCSTKGKSSTGR